MTVTLYPHTDASVAYAGTWRSDSSANNAHIPLLPLASGTAPTATCAIGGGAVTGINVSAGGSGLVQGQVAAYLTSTIANGGQGCVLATPTVSGGSIATGTPSAAITVTNGGQGYTVAPTVSWGYLAPYANGASTHTSDGWKIGNSGTTGGAANANTGSTATITVPAGTWAVYGSFTMQTCAANTYDPIAPCLVTVQVNSLSGALAAISGGATSVNQLVLHNSENKGWRAIVPLARKLDPTQSYTITLTVSGNSGSVQFDGYYAFSGSKPAMVKGLYYAMGDSITNATGAQNLFGPVWGYVPRVADGLRTRLGRDVVLYNRGIASDRFLGTIVTSQTNGMCWRLLNDLGLAGIQSGGIAPEFVTTLGGTNDMVGSQWTPGEIIRYMRWYHTLLEDLIDTAQSVCVTGTPPFTSPEATITSPWFTGNVVNATQAYNGSMRDNQFHMVGWMPNGLLTYSGWLQIANVTAICDDDPNLFYPNNNSANDLGTHPNEAGHSMIGEAVLTALLAHPNLKP